MRYVFDKTKNQVTITADNRNYEVDVEEIIRVKGIDIQNSGIYNYIYTTNGCIECIHAGVCKYNNDEDEYIVAYRKKIVDLQKGYNIGRDLADILRGAHMVCEIKCPDYKRREKV